MVSRSHLKDGSLWIGSILDGYANDGYPGRARAYEPAVRASGDGYDLLGSDDQQAHGYGGHHHGGGDVRESPRDARARACVVLLITAMLPHPSIRKQR